MNFSPHIVIAGGSGYVGQALISKLLGKFPHCQITGLSRSNHASEDKRMLWKSCDLFSLKSLEEALPENIDLAIYLVHSMAPTAHLEQGSFADYDLLLADNFSRALAKKNIKQIIYLGGIIPEASKLSQHLQSRLEVENTFRSYKLPLTVFRAGLILGEKGSSSQILLKLVERLPVMICPKWTQTQTAPVDLETVVGTIAASALETQHFQKTYDLCGCMPLSYLEMMRQTALKLGKKRYFLTAPFFTPTLSGLWVSLITNSPKSLVYPLIGSLEHPMVPRDSHLFPGAPKQRSYSDLLDRVVLKTHPGKSIFQFHPQRKTVRSVQRFPLPKGKDAQWVKEQYIQWLPSALSPFIYVTRHENTTLLSLFHEKIVLLALKFSPERSNNDRQLLYIIRGILVGKQEKGRLEFRVVNDRNDIMAAIHEFKPALPWPIYKYTQALVHLGVMRAFRKYLEKQQTKL